MFTKYKHTEIAVFLLKYHYNYTSKYKSYVYLLLYITFYSVKFFFFS